MGRYQAAIDAGHAALSQGNFGAAEPARTSSDRSFSAEPEDISSRCTIHSNRGGFILARARHLPYLRPP
jgi:hypothetical protein